MKVTKAFAPVTIEINSKEELYLLKHELDIFIHSMGNCISTQSPLAELYRKLQGV